MAKPRVIIADTDETYIISLQIKFVNDFFDKIELEIITEKEYFDSLFMTPQRAEILIVSEDLYDSSLQRHNIANIFLMTEQYEEGKTAELNIIPLFKYTSIKEIFNEIVGKSADALRVESKEKKESQIILVTSANGGAGKTTVAMGISSCLTKNYKRVLYINAGRLHSFQYMLDNQSTISSPEVYSRLAAPGEQIYSEIKHVIRKEMFSYLPPFKAALMSLGIEYPIYEQIAASAKKSGEYDFIVIDADSALDENKTRLMDLADKVIVVAGQSISAVYAANAFVSNINGTNTDKYIFVCNNFEKDEDNALISPNIILKFSVNEYIEHIEHYERIGMEDLSRENGIQKITFLLV